MWPFNKSDFSKFSNILSNPHICKIEFNDDATIERGGMFKRNELHGYGYYVDETQYYIRFGIFENGMFVKNMKSTIEKIQQNIGVTSKMISSEVFGKGVFLGEILSPAAYNDNPNLRRERYGILIMPEGMYVGVFPAGKFLTVCKGEFFDLNGKKQEGTFEFKVTDNNRYGDDKYGDYFPSF